MNIYQRINQVKKNVEYGQKIADTGRYKAISHDQVTALLRDEMIDKGIISTISLESGELKEYASNNRLNFLYDSIWCVRFINIDDKDDFLEIRVPCQVLGTDDKHAGKASSYAMKYGMLKTFGIVTGEDEESLPETIRLNREAKETEKDQYIVAIKRKIVKAEKEPQAVAEMVSNKKKSSIDDLTLAQLEEAEKMLDKRLSLMSQEQENQ